MTNDPLTLYGETFNSRFLLGTALYNSPQLMRDAITASGTDMVTLGLRRQNPEDKNGDAIWQYIKESKSTNTIINFFPLHLYSAD